MTNWTALVKSTGADVELRPRVTQDDVARAEDALGHALPADLAALFSETNGFYDKGAYHEPCWPLQRVVTENTKFRTEVRFPDAELKLCFGDNGAGEPFLHLAAGHGAWRPQVYAWSWIDQEARLLAPTLADFWRGWLSGTVTS